MTYIGHHTLAVQRGLNLGVALFIVSEALFFLAIFWAFFHKLSTLWIEAKFRRNPKALITKLHKETYKVAPLIAGGTVTSLEILDTNKGMGNRGSKSDSLISVKEQRVDGFSVFVFFFFDIISLKLLEKKNKYCKVYSKCQRNLVFMQYIKYVNTLFESIKRFCSRISYSNLQISLFSSKAMSSNVNYSFNVNNSSTNALNPYCVTGFTDGQACFYISVSSNHGYKTAYIVKAVFHIGVHIRDIALLEQIQLFFGVGTISKLGAESVQFRVSGSENFNPTRTRSNKENKRKYE